MNLTAVASRLGYNTGSGRELAIQGIHSRQAFQSILRRERARVGRNSHCFSLVVFRYVGDNGNGVAAGDKRFLRLVSSKVRFTDEVGILEDGEVGVLLPETEMAGACAFAQKVQYTTMRWPVTPEFTVHKYPDFDGDKPGDDPQLWLEGIGNRAENRADAGGPAKLDGMDSDSGTGTSSDETGMARYLSQPLPVWKRSFDIVAATVGLIIFSPVMLLMALHIKLTSPGPILFKQERIGYLGKKFQCLKFRTMHIDSDVSPHRQHLKDLIQSGRAMVKLDAREDPRIIPFGQTIRKAALDELAQLINILRGEMSFVGPRPCIPYEYKEFDPWHRMRTESHPGLTGLWQVSGKNQTTFTEMMRYDIAYARNVSLWLDISIAFRTIPAIVGQFKA